MIKTIRIHNFKSLKNIAFPARSLNILAGLNGMGKSSLIQALLLVKQSEALADRGRLNLNGGLVEIGSGQDALYQFAEDEIITFEFGLEEDKKLEWIFEYKASDVLQTHSNNDFALVQHLRDNIRYISADRLGPRSLHDTSRFSLEKNEFGSRGEFVVHYLQHNGARFKINQTLSNYNVEELSLRNQLNTWLGEISPGVRVNIDEIPGMDKVSLGYDFELKTGRTNSFRPSNVGFGISFALSVIVLLLTADKNSVVIIENPEAHIHPRGQSKLGRLMALCASQGVQIFLETHSDHIINGIRVAVKEQAIDHSRVGICWFDKETTEFEQFSSLKQIDLDKNGELSEYPEDLLDEWSNQLLRLV